MRQREGNLGGVGCEVYIRVVRWSEVQEFGEMCELEYYSTVYSLFNIRSGFEYWFIYFRFYSFLSLNSV